MLLSSYPSVKARATSYSTQLRTCCQRKTRSTACFSMSLKNLPAEIQLLVLSFLDCQSLINLTRTNLHFNLLLTERIRRASLHQFAFEDGLYHDFCSMFKDCSTVLEWLDRHLECHPYGPPVAVYRSIGRRCKILHRFLAVAVKEMRSVSLHQSANNPVVKLTDFL